MFRFKRLLALILSLGVLVTGCGAQSSANSGAKELPGVVRFVFAPDPVFKFMTDSGIVAEYEAKYNMKLVNSATWDEFPFFAGGHADIASTGDYELGPLIKETGLDITVFGQYNKSRSTFIARTDSGINTIADLKGKTISVLGPLGATMCWGAMLKKLYGVDFRVGSKEYNLFIEQNVAAPSLLDKKTVDAMLLSQEFAADYLASGEFKIIAPKEQTAWEFYRDNLDPQKKYGNVFSNIFVAKTDWIDKNPKKVQFFLDMWQAGLDAWNKDRAGIVKMYPEDFAIKSPEGQKWLIDYLSAGHDWWVPDITIDEEWIKADKDMLNLLKETGYMPQDIPDPKYKAIKIDARNK